MPVDNNSFQKNANTSLIANLIWKKGNISRADIARELNLYRSTVTNITSYLLENEVIREGSVRESTLLGGRRAVELCINPEFGCVFGFDIQPSHYRAVILLADGTEVWSEKGSFGDIPFEDMFVKALEKALKVKAVKNIPIIAVGYSVPGIIDAQRSVVLNSFPFHAGPLDIKEIVGKKYDLPVLTENDANTAAWLDIYNKKISGNALTVISDFHEEARINPDVVGVGTGMGVIINGSVYRGSHNAAGEFKTISWKKGLFNQSGLSNEILRDTLDSKESLALWIEDSCKSLVSLLSTMDFETILFHGNPYSDTEWVKKVVSERVPEFVEIVHNTGCELVFDTSDECISARGAAMMCLQKLFSIPELNSGVTIFNSWEKNIAFLKNQCKYK